MGRNALTDRLAGGLDREIQNPRKAHRDNAAVHGVHYGNTLHRTGVGSGKPQVAMPIAISMCERWVQLNDEDSILDKTLPAAKCKGRFP
ncbi:hypothetical protein [Schauerella aestuarii]|uniref:hypothetical protein n=1 Tax=Schauerella aestuarii TaxID=2511204 RepID=UPI00136D38FA|nr:hypothetical protein [Achromobacter aestuarii]MYZ45922.1 hypothetical protein [Achromobacter aestuarii]